MEEKQLKLGSITWPIMIDFLLMNSIFFLDSYFLSQISDNAAGTIGSIFFIFITCNSVFFTVYQAGTSVSSQYIGGKQEKNIIPTYITTLLLNIFIGIVLSLLLFINSSNIGLWMGFSTELNMLSESYLKIMSFICCIWAMRYSFAVVFNSKGLSIWNMLASIPMNLICFGLNIIFLKGLFGVPKLGVQGVALSSIISQFTVVILQAILINNVIKVRFYVKNYSSYFKTTLINILKIGVPSSLEPLVYNIAQVIMAYMVVKISILAMSTKIFVTSFIVLINITFTYAFGAGNQVIVAHLLGAKDYDAVNNRLNRSVILSMGVSCALAVIIYLLSNSLLSIFTNNKEIIKLGSTLLMIGILMEPMRTSNVVVSMALKGCGDAKFPSYFAMFNQVFFFLPLCYYFGLSLGYGLIGIWIVSMLDESIRAAANYWRWRQRQWEKTGVNANIIDEKNEIITISEV